jgi:protein-disulfide isomerase
MPNVGIEVGPQGAAGAQVGSGLPRVDTFVDYMCPFCKRFETSQGPALQQLVDEGHAEWVTHPLAFLDRLSAGTSYSTRSAGAAFAVATLAPQTFGAFNAAMFANQPEEGGPGLTDAQLAELAQAAGMSADDAAHLTDAQYVEAAQAETSDAIELGVQGTPTILVSRAGVGQVLWDGETPLAALVRQLQEA